MAKINWADPEAKKLYDREYASASMARGKYEETRYLGLDDPAIRRHSWVGNTLLPIMGMVKRFAEFALKTLLPFSGVAQW